MNSNTRVAKILSVLLLFGLGTAGANAKSEKATVKGYVLDSACAFTRNLDKPISKSCARACARAGSPLVLLTDDGTVYWPIANTTPATGQNKRLMPFAGQRVIAKGEVFERSGSRAIVIDTIEPEQHGK